MSDSLDRDGFPAPQDDFGVQNPFISPVAEARVEGHKTPVGEPLNPWISMWTKPRATVRQQLDTDPAQYVLLLAILGGISGVYDDVDFDSEILAERIGLFVGAAIGGAIFGIIWLYLSAWLTGIAGRSIGGVGNAAQVRTALAWSNIPTVWLLPLNLGVALSVAVLGPERVFGAIVQAQNDPAAFDLFAMPTWFFALAALGVVVLLWQIVITCQAVGEAHEFSSWKGLGALMLSGLMLMGIVMAIAFVVFGALFGFGLLQ